MSGRVAAYSWTHIFWPSGFDLQWPWLHSPALRSSFQRSCRHPHPCFSHVATPWKLHIQNSAASLSWPHHPPPAWPPSPKDLPHHLQSPSQCCLPSHLLHHHAQPSFSDEHPQSTNSFKVYPIKITILIILYVNFQKKSLLSLRLQNTYAGGLWRLYSALIGLLNVCIWPQTGILPGSLFSEPYELKVRMERRMGIATCRHGRGSGH